MAELEFERKIIPADADEIAEKFSQVVRQRKLENPLSIYLLNLSAIRSLQAIGLVVWEDTDPRYEFSLEITRFFDERGFGEIGTMASASANLIKMVSGRFQERIQAIDGLRVMKYELPTAGGI